MKLILKREILRVNPTSIYAREQYFDGSVLWFYHNLNNFPIDKKTSDIYEKDYQEMLKNKITT